MSRLLADRYATGASLSEREVDALREWLRADPARLAELVRLEEELQRLGTDSVLESAISVRQTHGSSRRFARWAVGVAASIGVLIGAVFGLRGVLSERSGEVVLRVAAVVGGVPDGSVAIWQGVRKGDRLDVGVDQYAQLEFVDGTSGTLYGPASLSVGRGDRLLLEVGVIELAFGEGLGSVGSVDASRRL